MYHSERRRPLLTKPKFGRGSRVKCKATGEEGIVTLYRPINGEKAYRVVYLAGVGEAKAQWHAGNELEVA
jgi:hypothetical protein